MNNNQKKLLKKYAKQVSRCFPYGYPDKKKIINDLKTNLILFSNEHSEFSYKDLYDNFGSPNSYADSIIIFSSPDELRNNIKMKKRTIFIILLIMVFILTATAFAIITIVKFQGSIASHGYETIIEY